MYRKKSVIDVLFKIQIVYKTMNTYHDIIGAFTCNIVAAVVGISLLLLLVFATVKL